MAADDRVVVYGEDVGPLGGVFRVTDGLQAAVRRGPHLGLARSPSRASSAPRIGMAMYGMRPVVEMQFDAFSYPAFEQMVSHVAKMRNRTKGRVALPDGRAHPLRRRDRRRRAPLRLLRGVLDLDARPHGRDAVEPRRRLLDAARGDRQRRPRRLHGAEEPLLVEGAARAARDDRADGSRRRSCARAPT